MTDRETLRELIWETKEILQEALAILKGTVK